jgi:hypothetical protein
LAHFTRAWLNTCSFLHQLDEDLLLDRTGRLAQITSSGWSFAVEKEWRSFVALRDAGFDFYFLPNG